MDKKLELALDKVFSKHAGKNNIIFENYSKLYNLEKIVHKSEVSEKLFDYVLRKKFFVLLVIYDEDGKIFLDRNVADTLYWGLPGGSIRDDETVHMAINRISKSIDDNIIIGDVEPLAIIENVFNHESEKYSHIGIAFMARIRNKSQTNINNLIGDFIKPDKSELEFVKRFASKRVIELFIKRFKDIKVLNETHFQEDEITSNEKSSKRYDFHNKIVKKYILTDKLKKKQIFKKVISDRLQGSNSIIDVSCGDDKFLFNISRELGIDFVVGNDISWSQVEKLNKLFNEVIFTNHNATTMPFGDGMFDLSYCSNTLHHMPDKKSLLNLLENMFRISNKMLIVEIENPRETGGIPHLLNRYWYIGYLGDVGGSFMNSSEFKILISTLFKNRAKVEFSNFKNITGNYMIAQIEKAQGKG